MKVSEVAESCPTLSNPTDRSLPGSSVHGIFQARVLEWDAIAFSEIHDKVYLMTTPKTSRLCHVAKLTPPKKRKKWLRLRVIIGLPWWLRQQGACNTGHPVSVSGSGRCPGEGNGNPLRYSCLGNPTDRRAWRATVHGVAKNWTWLSDQHYKYHHGLRSFPVAQMVKNLSAQVWSLGWEDPPWRREWLPTPICLPGEFH